MHKIESVAFVKTDKGNPRLSMINRGQFMGDLADSYPHMTKVLVTIERFRDKRSLEANSLLHVWIGLIAKEVGHDTDTCKEWLKGKFLRATVEDINGNPLIDRETGEVVTKVLKTSELDTKEFDTFMEKIRIWALEFLNLDLTI